MTIIYGDEIIELKEIEDDSTFIIGVFQRSSISEDGVGGGI